MKNPLVWEKDQHDRYKTNFKTLEWDIDLTLCHRGKEEWSINSRCTPNDENAEFTFGNGPVVFTAANYDVATQKAFEIAADSLRLIGMNNPYKEVALAIQKATTPFSLERPLTTDERLGISNSIQSMSATEYTLHEVSDEEARTWIETKLQEATTSYLTWRQNNGLK